MTDKELLELAAKAADFTLHRWNATYVSYETDQGLWNPLLNDGDALRLAVKLHIDLVLCKVMNTTEAWGNISDSTTGVCERHGRSAGAATRRAIVRAAAAMAQAVQPAGTIKDSLTVQPT